MFILYELFLAAGCLLLLAGFLITRSAWRDDIEPFNRKHFIFHIAMHPSRYAKPDKLLLIRALFLLGGCCLCGALGAVIIDVIGSIKSGQ